MKIKTKANLQRVIGIISGILLIVSYVGGGILSIIVLYQITQNPDLLRELGYDPNDFSFGFDEGLRFLFHIFGLLAIIAYLVPVAERAVVIPAKAGIQLFRSGPLLSQG